MPFKVLTSIFKRFYKMTKFDNLSIQESIDTLNTIIKYGDTPLLEEDVSLISRLLDSVNEQCVAISNLFNNSN